MLVRQRKRRRWSVEHAVARSQDKHPGVLTWNVLTRLERGKTKHPDSDALRAIADLYGQDYMRLAGAFIERNYGLGVRQTNADAASDTSPNRTDSDFVMEPSQARQEGINTSSDSYTVASSTRGDAVAGGTHSGFSLTTIKGALDELEKSIATLSSVHVTIGDEIAKARRSNEKTGRTGEGARRGKKPASRRGRH